VRVASREDEVREDYRSPTDREREILAMLLSVQMPGIEELRTQARSVRVARWKCGCSSFNIEVDRSVAPRSSAVHRNPVIDAESKERRDPLNAFDLLLWVEDGWLAGVEIVDYRERHGDDSPDEIPPPDQWQLPRVHA
jgi:hypothetical protein